ncbi:Hypothetical predicted protein [Mytilus galloprovincialis]|uniref:Uncharacterized protein n=1 Tax=Mytilus galloprovincialis TaxID=29158 RepID=A0A8B6G1C1_MYTGA|nr:Hypothetical predicted protein [Mytilus galloprovincialis]
MKDGEILLKELGGNTIQLLSLSGEVKTVLDTFQMRPLAIHVNKDNEVIVGMREQGPPFPVQDFSVRQLIIFGSGYQRKVTLEFDKGGNKLFSNANRIRTDSRNVVYVIDRFDNANHVIVGMREQGPPFPVQDFSVRQLIIFGSGYQRKVTLKFDKGGNKLFSNANRIRTDSRNVLYVIDRFDNANHGRIVAVDINGCLNLTYDGPKDLGTFQPEGITITPSDNIVVADFYNKALHVINSKGDFLGLLFIFKDLDINYPSILCFDTEGYLSIGCCRGENEGFGKIHFVKILDSLM